MIRLLFIITALFCMYGCGINDDKNIVAEGVLLELGMTVFQYGSHQLVDDAGDLLYALESTEVDLDKYLKKEVEVIGIFYDMGNLEGGPGLIDVISVQFKN